MEFRAIYHAEGEERENHKYVARVLIKKGSGKKPNTYRYFYDKKEYADYLKDKEEKEKSSGGLDKLVNDLFSGKANIGNSKSGESFINGLLKNDTKTDSIANEAKIKIYENVENGKTLVNDYISENGGEAIDKIKNTNEAGKITAKEFLSTVLTSGIGMAVAEFVYDAIATVQDNKFKEFLEKERRSVELLDNLNKVTDYSAYNNPLEYVDPNGYDKLGDRTMVAYDMLMRGYDVKTLTTSRPGTWSLEDVSEVYYDAKVKKHNLLFNDGSEFRKLSDKLVENGHGARGFIEYSVTDEFGFTDKKSLIWEVDGDMVVYTDPTNGVRYLGHELDYSRIDYAEGSSIKYLRTDNLDINENCLNYVENQIDPSQDSETTEKDQDISERDDRFPDLNLKTEEFTKDEDQAAINPDYDEDNYGTSMNCTYCTAAYDLRQRGYDVEAMEIVETDDPTTMNEVASWYEGAEWNYGSLIVNDPSNAYDYMSSLSDSEIDTIVDSLEEYEDGSYGHMMLWWSGGYGGHDVVWEVENGEVKFRDCQTNEVVDPKDYLELCYDCDYFRADNLELADEIERVVRNRR